MYTCYSSDILMSWILNLLFFILIYLDLMYKDSVWERGTPTLFCYSTNDNLQLTLHLLFLGINTHKWHAEQTSTKTDINRGYIIHKSDWCQVKECFRFTQLLIPISERRCMKSSLRFQNRNVRFHVVFHWGFSCVPVFGQ